MKNPFIHKFDTQKSYYIYDVNTNNIIKSGQLVYDIIADYGVMSFSEIIHKWKKKYEGKVIRESLNRIHESHKSQGLFSPNRPTTMVCPMREEQSLQKLSDLILDVTERCNLRCKYCIYSGTYSYERKHSLRNMSWVIAKKAVDYFCSHCQDYNVYNVFGEVVSKEKANISFYGGEGLINFNLIKKIVGYVKTINQSVGFRVDTNGTIFNREIMRFLIDNDIMLQVSIDGPAEEHDKFRVFKNGRGSFNVIVKNLQKLQQMDRAYYEKRVCFVVTLSSAYNLLNIYKFFSSFDLVKEKSLLVGYINPYDTDFFRIFSKQMKKLQWEKDRKKLLKQYIDLRVINGSVSQLMSGLFEKPLIMIHRRQIKPMMKNCGPNGICVPGVRKLFVDVEGKFYPCEKVGRAFCIGDVDKEIEVQKVRSIIETYIKESTKDCLNCWAVRLCKLCFTSARKGDKFDFERKKERCVNERNSLHNSLVLYTKIMEKNPKAFDFVKDMTFS